MKLLLSSKGLINEPITEAFLSLTKSRKRITIITTASQDYKDKNKNTIRLNNQLTELGFATRYIDLEFDDPKCLAESEVMIICGGNPYYLMYHIRKSKSENVISDLMAKQIPIWGISAGFMILMSDLGIIDLLTPEMNRIGLLDKECLGIIDEIVVPHYDRFIKEGKIRIEDIDRFEIKSGKNIIRLGEYQYVNYTGNRLEIVGELMK